MKKLAVIITLVIASLTTQVSAMSSDPFWHRGEHNNRPGKGAVGAPLDGSLLLLLAGAGVAYYSAKKNKEANKE